MNIGSLLSPLSIAVQRYVQAAMPLLSSAQPGELIRLPGGRWKASSAGHFEREDDADLSWVIAIHRRRDQIHALPEYRECIALIRSNEAWRPQFGTLVGTAYSSMRLDEDGFLDACLSDAMSAAVLGRDALAVVAERVASMEKFLESSELPVEVISPLMGLGADTGHIQVDNGLEIAPVDEAEVGRLYSVGLLLPAMAGFPSFVSPPSHVARATFLTPKVIGAWETPPDTKTLAEKTRRANDAIDELLGCLRLFKAGRVSLGGRATVVPSHAGLSFHGPVGPLWPTAFQPKSYTLSSEEVRPFLGLWRELHSTGIAHTPHLGLAARRFAYMGDRGRVDDQMVDLMVAAEALLLGDITGDRTELGFRLAIRAASYIEDPDRSKRSIFELVRAAYGMRSLLLHGREAKPATVDGKELTLEQMVTVIEGLVRRGLCRATSEASKRSARWTVDWDGLMFSASDLG